MGYTLIRKRVMQVTKRISALKKIFLVFVSASALVVCHTNACAMPLYRDLTRLHVVANSNSVADQQLKLKVRDAVLEKVQKITAETTDADSAYRRICDKISEIENTAQRAVYDAGYEYNVTATVRPAENFPRRTYDTFALPAGNYRTLRVEIGEGEGQNWWCVVFPPLCTSGAIEEKSGLSDSTLRLITEEGTEYELRFFLLDLLASLR